MSAPLAAAARRAEPLLPSPLNWVPKTGRSRRRKSLSRSALGFPEPGRSQSAPVIAILPGNENERAGSGFHSRPSGLRGGQEPGPAGAQRRGLSAHQPGGVGPARSLSLEDVPSGSLALAPRRTEVRFCGIWGAEGTPGPWVRTATDQLHGIPVCLRIWMGGDLLGCPPGTGASTLPGPDPSPACRWALPSQQRPTVRAAVLLLLTPDPSTLWILAGTFPQASGRSRQATTPAQKKET